VFLFFRFVFFLLQNLRFILVKNKLTSGHKIPENFDGDQTELNEHFVVEIPISARFTHLVGMLSQF